MAVKKAKKTKTTPKKVPKKEVAPVVYNGKLDDREIASAFNVSEHDMQRRAWTQLLEEFIENAIDQAENPDNFNCHGNLAAAVGGQLALREYKKHIMSRFERAGDVLAGLDEPRQTTKGY